MVSPAVLQALSIGALPDVEWQADDDLCDCTYQRIGMWRNPYLAETLIVRVCCIWADLYKQYPQFVQQIPGYWNDETEQWDTEPWAWNGEDEMAPALWHRQLARKYGITVAAARALNLAPPKGQHIRAKPLFFLPWGGEYIEVTLGA